MTMMMKAKNVNFVLYHVEGEVLRIYGNPVPSRSLIRWHFVECLEELIVFKSWSIHHKPV